MIRLVCNSYCRPRFGCDSFGCFVCCFAEREKCIEQMCLLEIVPDNNCKYFKKWVRYAEQSQRGKQEQTVKEGGRNTSSGVPQPNLGFLHTAHTLQASSHRPSDTMKSLTCRPALVLNPGLWGKHASRPQHQVPGTLVYQPKIILNCSELCLMCCFNHLDNDVNWR